MIAAIRRQQAAQATVNRFKGEPLVFGKNDCARMAVFVLRKMGRRPKIANAGSYSSPIGAKRALAKLGHDSLASALDAMGLERIPPAAALPADILMLPGDGPFGGALMVAVGNGRALGYHEDLDGADIMQPVEILAAWRS